MKPFNNLSEPENQRLIKFPAYVSMLAATKDDKLDEKEKKIAMKIAHIKTYSSPSFLAEYFREADKAFENNIMQLDKELPKDKYLREAAIKEELLKLDEIVSKLGKKYALMMLQTMNSFKEHVSKAHHSVLEDFVFTLQISGLTDR